MENALDGHTVGGGKSSTSIDMPNLDDILGALPDRVGHTRARTFTPEEDEALRKYWPVKRQADIAKALGVSIGTARARYEALIGG